MRKLVTGIVLALLALPSAALADGCKKLTKDDPSFAISESTDARLRDTIDGVRQIAGVTIPYIACEWVGGGDPSPSTILDWDVSRRFSEARLYILFHRELLPRLSDAALVGCVAHEYGHAAEGPEHWVMQTKDTDLDRGWQYEKDADAAAARMVGKDAIKACLTEYTEFAVEYARAHAYDEKFMAFPIDFFVTALEIDMRLRLKALDGELTD